MDEGRIIRKCVSCNKLKPRTDLIRITIKKTTKEIRVSPASDFVGRSVYLCKDFECINNAFKKGKLFKILKINADDNLKQKISAVLEK